jgi:hypothetical protein
MQSGSVNQLNFALEDTAEKCYRDIVDELLAKGWNRVNYRKRSKLEKRRYFFVVFSPR